EPAAIGVAQGGDDQATRSESRGGVLVIADADDDCAVELAQQLHEAAAPTAIEVAIAVREFEAWFLGAIESLRAHRAVRDKATFDGDAERLGGAKGHLARLMTESYRETLHQPAFAKLMDLASARRLRSFEHLVGCVGRLLGPSTPRPQRCGGRKPRPTLPTATTGRPGPSPQGSTAVAS